MVKGGLFRRIREIERRLNIVAFIFARGGSKGLPGKNIRLFGGKPLIAWSIEQAKAVSRIRRVIVSTDSAEIAEVAMKYGAEVPFIRPAHLATDDAPEWLAWRHALEYVREEEGQWPDAMVSVPVTAPLRQAVDLENCLDAFVRGGVDMVITVCEARRNPYFNMVKMNHDGTVGLVIPTVNVFARRQDVPVVFDMTTVAYVTNPAFVLKHDAIFNGRVRAVEVPVERSIDIDTIIDFQVAEFLLGMTSIQ